MIIPTLCMASFILVLWVIVLKLRIDDLKKENKKLRTILERNFIKIDESLRLKK